MKRNLKALGIALVAVFAMSAVMASGASAKYSFGAETGTQTVTATSADNIFTTSGGEVKCTSAQFTGTVTPPTAQKQIIEPHYSGCTAFGALTTHVNATPCTYEFNTPTVTLNATEFTGAPPVVKCPTTAISLTPTFLGGSVCTVTVGQQTITGSGHVIYKNEGAGATRDVKVTVTTGKNIHYNVSGGGGLCGATGAHIDGEYTGTATLRGFKNAAHTEHGGIFVSH